MRDAEFYNSNAKEQTLKKQRKILSLSQKGKLDTLKVYDTLYYNEQQFVDTICSKGQLPLSKEEFEAEPFLYYADTHKTIRKAHYAYEKLGIPKYINMQNFKACFKMNDVFTVEIREISKWYNIPIEAIKKDLIKLWQKYNKPEKILNRITFDKN